MDVNQPTPDQLSSSANCRSFFFLFIYFRGFLRLYRVRVLRLCASLVINRELSVIVGIIVLETDIITVYNKNIERKS